MVFAVALAAVAEAGVVLEVMLPAQPMAAMALGVRGRASGMAVSVAVAVVALAPAPVVMLVEAVVIAFTPQLTLTPLILAQIQTLVILETPVFTVAPV
jgi:hypothetical protein